MPKLICLGIEVIGQNFQHVGPALSDVVGQKLDPVDAHEREKRVVLFLEIAGLAIFGFHRGELALEDRHDEIPAAASGLQKARVDALRLAFDQIEHRLDQPRRGEYLAVIRGKTAELFAAACEVGPVLANRPKAEQTACRSVGMNLGIAFQLVDDVLDYGGKAAKLGKNIGDDFREGKITLPVVLAFRRGNDSERAFWVRALERGEIGDSDLDHAIGLMTKHRALEDTIVRAQHYGAMAVDALALFPPSPMKSALEQVVAFCLARSH